MSINTLTTRKGRPMKLLTRLFGTSIFYFVGLIVLLPFPRREAVRTGQHMQAFVTGIEVVPQKQPKSSSLELSSYQEGTLVYSGFGRTRNYGRKVETFSSACLPFAKKHPSQP